jgi:hypothetical protein
MFDIQSTYASTDSTPRADDVVARLALIKPNGSGDTGMAEERG